MSSYQALRAKLHEVEAEIGAWETAKKVVLDAMPPAHRAAWAAACLERVAFVWGRSAEWSELTQKAVGIAWRIANGGEATAEERSELKARFDRELPGSDGDFDGSWAAMGFASAAERSLDSTRVSGCLGVATQAREAIERFSELIEDAHPMAQPEAIAEEFAWQKRAFDVAQGGASSNGDARSAFATLLDEHAEWRRRYEAQV